MTDVAFPYKLAGVDLTVDAEFEKPANRHDDWQLCGIEVKNPEGEEINDDLHNLYVRLPDTAIYVSVLSQITREAFEQAEMEEAA